MPDLRSLIQTVTSDSLVRGILDELASAKMPVTNWGTGSTARTLIEAFTETLARAYAIIPDIAAGGYLDLAEGDWLTLLAQSAYSLTRTPAARTKGYVTLTIPSNVGPYTWAVGGLTVATDSGVRYTNAEAISLTPGASLGVLFQADAEGSAGNVLNGTITRVTAGLQAGLTVANSSYAGTGTWITVAGRDVESDPELRARCRNRWATLGSGTTARAVSYLATSCGASTVSRVRCYTDLGTGVVRVYLAGSNGARVSDADLALVTQVLNQVRPLCMQWAVYTSAVVGMPIGGTVTCYSTMLESAKTAAQAALTSYMRSIGSGGTVRINRIIGALNQPGVKSILVTNTSTGATYAQTDDIVLAQDTVPSLDVGAFTFVSA